MAHIINNIYLDEVYVEDIVNGTYIIPDVIEELYTDAFCDLNGLKFIVIPESVKFINDGCFAYNYNLKSVKILNRDCIIGSEAFKECESLEEVELPENLEVLCERTFYNCIALKSIKLPKNLKGIGYSAFGSCTALEEIEIPQSVTTLISEAFMGCTGLKKITCNSDNMENITNESLNVLNLWKSEKMILGLYILLNNVYNIEEVVLDEDVLKVTNVSGKTYIIENKEEYSTRLQGIEIYKVRDIMELLNNEKLLIGKERYTNKYYMKYKDKKVIGSTLEEADKKISEIVKKEFIGNII